MAVTLTFGAARTLAAPIITLPRTSDSGESVVDGLTNSLNPRLKIVLPHGELGDTLRVFNNNVLKSSRVTSNIVHDLEEDMDWAEGVQSITADYGDGTVLS